MLHLNVLVSHNNELESLHNAAFEAARLYNAVINETDTTKVDAAEKAATIAKDKFNSAALDTAYAIFLADEKPILAALKCAEICQIAVKVKNSKESKSVEASDEGILINLDDFDKYAAQRGVKVMSSSVWRGRIDEARKMFSGSCAFETQEEATIRDFKKKFDTTFAYAFSGARFDCGEKDLEKRYSKSACVRALQDVVDAVIFDDPKNGGKNTYRALNSDMNVIRLTITKRGKSLHSLSFPNFNSFLKSITDALVRIVNNGVYSCEYTAK